MPEVLFVSSSNMGLSRILEGLLRQAAPQLTIVSAGTSIDEDDRGIDEDARRALIDVGARCDGDPQQLTPSLADAADVVIIVGDVNVSEYIAPDVSAERWEVDDPSLSGVFGYDRYVQLRDAFAPRVRALAHRFAQ